MATRNCKRVSRDKARRKSGPNKGQLNPGCRYIKGDGAQCCTPGAKKGKAKKGTTKRKATKRKRKGTKPNTPAMDALNSVRRAFKSASSCKDKRVALRALKKRFQFMAKKPANKKRGESQGAASTRRWGRWQSEYKNKLNQTESLCSGRKTRVVGPGMVSGLSAAGKKKHPCTRANPPAWCGK
jgi:hypothetical protein